MSEIQNQIKEAAKRLGTTPDEIEELMEKAKSLFDNTDDAQKVLDALNEHEQRVLSEILPILRRAIPEEYPTVEFMAQKGIIDPKTREGLKVLSQIAAKAGISTAKLIATLAVQNILPAVLEMLGNLGTQATSAIIAATISGIGHGLTLDSFVKNMPSRGEYEEICKEGYVSPMFVVTPALGPKFVEFVKRFNSLVDRDGDEEASVRLTHALLLGNIVGVLSGLTPSRRTHVPLFDSRDPLFPSLDDRTIEECEKKLNEEDEYDGITVHVHTQGLLSDIAGIFGSSDVHKEFKNSTGAAPSDISKIAQGITGPAQNLVPQQTAEAHKLIDNVASKTKGKTGDYFKILADIAKSGINMAGKTANTGLQTFSSIGTIVASMFASAVGSDFAKELGGTIADQAALSTKEIGGTLSDAATKRIQMEITEGFKKKPSTPKSQKPPKLPPRPKKTKDRMDDERSFIDELLDDEISEKGEESESVDEILEDLAEEVEKVEDIEGIDGILDDIPEESNVEENHVPDFIKKVFDEDPLVKIATTPETYQNIVDGKPVEGLDLTQLPMHLLETLKDLSQNMLDMGLHLPEVIGNLVYMRTDILPLHPILHPMNDFEIQKFGYAVGTELSDMISPECANNIAYACAQTLAHRRWYHEKSDGLVIADGQIAKIKLGSDTPLVLSNNPDAHWVATLFAEGEHYPRNAWCMIFGAMSDRMARICSGILFGLHASDISVLPALDAKCPTSGRCYGNIE